MKGIELGFAGALTTDMYGSYNAAGNPVEVSPETQGGRIFTIHQGENGEVATVSNEWVAYDWVRDTNGSDKTPEIGEGPFDGQAITLESGKAIQKRVGGYNETPLTKAPSPTPFFRSPPARAITAATLFRSIRAERSPLPTKRDVSTTPRWPFLSTALPKSARQDI